MYDFRSGQWHSPTFSEPVYSLFTMGNPEYEASTFRYAYQSLVTPSSVYDYDMETHESTLLKQQEVLGGYDPAKYVCERLWATARDGTKVPLSIVYKKGLQARRQRPLLAVCLRLLRRRARRPRLPATASACSIAA